eukprot:Cvel_21163.t3-p1 / transcript=Cvel_21163.t3 / gene=Cvel_21163 / organism=Chromera_velia_CCMP2878 / gene_product=Importin-13, putative / transcript_product=Importin-13, putative / location=Cvel_scaffold1963:12621-27853(-) / protein_length=1257 / sequence_SO=supercontig / SO=protein_coding / is_pseudo=false
MAVNVDYAFVEQRVRDLWFGSDPQARQAANAWMMQFQNTPEAWTLSHNLISSTDATFQFVGLQVLHYKIRHQFSTFPGDPRTLISKVAEYLSDDQGRLQQVARLRAALCLGGLVLRAITGVWQTAVEDVIQIARSAPPAEAVRRRILVCNALGAAPEELRHLALQFVKRSPQALALLAKAPEVISFLQECLSACVGAGVGTSDSSPLVEAAAQCGHAWASNDLDISLFESPELSGAVASLLSGFASSDSFLEFLRRGLRNSKAYQYNWKMAEQGLGQGGPTAAQLLGLPGEGAILSSLLTQLSRVAPGMQRLAAQGGSAPLDEKDERTVAGWAELVFLIGEGFPQLFMQLPEELAAPLGIVGGIDAAPVGVFRSIMGAHPRGALPLFSFFANVKEMKNENLLDDVWLGGLLGALTDPTVRALAGHCRRDNKCWADVEEGELKLYREAAEYTLGDLWLLCDKLGREQGESFIVFLAKLLEVAIGKQDCPGCEVLVFFIDVIFECVCEVRPSLFQILALMQQVPLDVACGQKTIQLVKKITHLTASSGDLALPCFRLCCRFFSLVPGMAAGALKDLADHAGRRLASDGVFGDLLALAEREAVNQTPCTDALLFASLAHVTGSLPDASVHEGTARALNSTVTALQAMVGEGSPPLFSASGNALMPQAQADRQRAHDAFRLLCRFSSLVDALAGTLEEIREAPGADRRRRPLVQVCEKRLEEGSPEGSPASQLLLAVLASRPSQAHGGGGGSSLWELLLHLVSGCLRSLSAVETGIASPSLTPAGHTQHGHPSIWTDGQIPTTFSESALAAASIGAVRSVIRGVGEGGSELWSPLLSLLSGLVAEEKQKLATASIAPPSAFAAHPGGSVRLLPALAAVSWVPALIVTSKRRRTELCEMSRGGLANLLGDAVAIGQVAEQQAQYDALSPLFTLSASVMIYWGGMTPGARGRNENFLPPSDREREVASALLTSQVFSDTVRLAMARMAAPGDSEGRASEDALKASLLLAETASLALLSLHVDGRGLGVGMSNGGPEGTSIVQRHCCELLRVILLNMHRWPRLVFELAARLGLLIQKGLGGSVTETALKIWGGDVENAMARCQQQIAAESLDPAGNPSDIPQTLALLRFLGFAGPQFFMEPRIQNVAAFALGALKAEPQLRGLLLSLRDIAQGLKTVDDMVAYEMLLAENSGNFVGTQDQSGQEPLPPIVDQLWRPTADRNVSETGRNWPVLTNSDMVEATAPDAVQPSKNGTTLQGEGERKGE